MSADGGIYDTLNEGGYPYGTLGEGDVRVALDTAIGMLDDAGLRADFAQAGEEAIIEARNEAANP